jgi:hypothetical protein
MKLEDDIVTTLKAEQHNLNALLAEDSGLFNRLGQAYQGHTKKWMVISTILAILLTMGFLYCGYQFFNVTELSHKLSWGAGFFTCFITQVTIKLWMHMEVNRLSVIKEIKHSEIEVIKALNNPK